MTEPADPVSHAVEKCLAYACAFDSPAAAAADFLALLKVGGAFTTSEIAEVATRVADKLGERTALARLPKPCNT
jgi:hypothetical protein